MENQRKSNGKIIFRFLHFPSGRARARVHDGCHAVPQALQPVQRQAPQRAADARAVRNDVVRVARPEFRYAHHRCVEGARLPGGDGLELRRDRADVEVRRHLHEPVRREDGLTLLVHESARLHVEDVALLRLQQHAIEVLGIKARTGGGGEGKETRLSETAAFWQKRLRYA